MNAFISDANPITFSLVFLVLNEKSGRTPNGSLATKHLEDKSSIIIRLSSKTKEKTPSSICKVCSIP